MQLNRFRAKDDLEALLSSSEELAGIYRRALGVRADELQQLIHFIVEALARQRHRPRWRYDKELHFRNASGLVAYLLHKNTESRYGSIQYDLVAQYVKAHPVREVSLSTPVGEDPDTGKTITLENRLQRGLRGGRVEVEFEQPSEEY